jgi:glycine cleavage system aminomethyltransferase T
MPQEYQFFPIGKRIKGPPMSELLRTPLRQLERKTGAKMVFLRAMPVQYPMGVMQEHIPPVKAGLFDVAIWGRVIITGDD